MKKVIITCDRCRKDISSKDQQKWNVQIQYACGLELWQTSGSKSKAVTWCRECFELSGMIAPVESKKAIEEGKGLSFEDMIREIVREGMEASQ